MMPGTTTSVLMLVLPWPLLTVGLVIGVGADQHARLMRRSATGATYLALACAVSAALTYALGATNSVTYLSAHLPAGLGVLAVSTYVDALTVMMLVLVAFIGMIVVRYSSTYMDGDAHEGRFHRWLSLTLGSFLTLIVAGNVWSFLLSWIATSMCLHELLAFYRDRPGAVLAARKKYLLHRISDASLLAAFVLIAHTLRTAQFADVAHALAAMPRPLPTTLQVATGLVVVSAILKSAQFPSHGWLIQVMEAPTPVSALMHAGIIYTGAFLILRTSPIVSQVAWAGNTLILVGLLSITTASLMMMVATNIKGSLAYSTSAQMGFMLMECGLGLYSVAVLHITAHSVYKAHAFLSSGSVVDNFRVPALLRVSGAAPLWQAVFGLVVAALMTIAIGFSFGVKLQQQPGLIVMGLLLTVAMTQLLLQALNARTTSTGRMLLQMASLSALVCIAYFGLHTLFTQMLGASLPVESLKTDGVTQSVLGLIVVVFLGLLFVQQALPRMQKTPFWRAAYVHLYNDLYMDVFLTRLVRILGPAGASASSQTPFESPPFTDVQS